MREAAKILFGGQEDCRYPAQHHPAIPPAAHPVGPEAHPGIGALNDIGGPQAATQGQRQLQAIKGEGFFQAFPQAGRSSGCTSYSGPKVFRKFPRIKMPDLEAKAKSSGSTATQRKIYAKIPPCG